MSKARYRVAIIFLIILLVIGIYTYAHMNRYQVFTVSAGSLRMLIKYDNWTDRTFFLVYPTDNVWIELREIEKRESEE